MYCKVENNVVVNEIYNLPKSYQNIFFFDEATPDVHRAYGFYPLIEMPFSCEQTQKRGNKVYEISEQIVYASYEVLDKTEGELQQESAEYLKMLVDAVQLHMDNTAKERNYDGILSLCTYATSTNPRFLVEGQSGVEWRDAVWAKCYQVMEEYQLGQRTIPTTESLIAELPSFTWGE